MDDGSAYSHEHAEGEDERMATTAAEKRRNTSNGNSNGPGSGQAGHKRQLSGGLLSKLSFLSTLQSQDPSDDGEEIRSREDDGTRRRDDAERRNGAGTAPAVLQQQQKKSRRRKGSLRKTALLGTGKLRMEGREWRERTGAETFRSGYGGQRQQQAQSLELFVKENKYGGQTDSDTSPIETPKQNSFGSEPDPSSSPWSLRINTAYLNGKAVGVDSKNGVSRGEQVYLTPIASPGSADASTTDEEDMLTFPRHSPNPGTVTLLPAPPGKKPSNSDTSYFPQGPTSSTSTLSRRKLTNASSTSKPQSSQATQPQPSIDLPPSSTATAASLILAATAGSDAEWDYADTAWWGWVVLIVTWIVFVVGMGSCLGVWSWAWDVGETPYAPPELEDDPTLPITGYYPALMILTGVMAWVWVVVAWIGMKYFKHAKISGEDG